VGIVQVYESGALAVISAPPPHFYEQNSGSILETSPIRRKPDLNVSRKKSPERVGEMVST
jgi:hypothetical protein